ncbi:uncharacterized protein LOC115443783 isoform X2 [Manduca sexta]|uniref:Regulatory protein zeste n=1 Tax=Manduca sexta TaxID=7130 RepID=A0A922CLP5_MANSE|nr:uncharacterized protein LOC119188327 isoform X2 [Manduca sexta]XP_037301844.1 uncharacterized protein LOC115443783 isoform X2 [Manduca sexta]KAG6450499.1 hypothetical protein O3G_MSEX006597 [Manduca sexta]
MSETDEFSESVRVSRTSLAQVRAIVDFMEKHPDLAHRKLRVGMGHAKFKKLWVELANIANSIDGASKSTKGWIKFWSDKRRSILIKQKQIENGKLLGQLSPLEQKILCLCDDKSCTQRKRKPVKQEPCNGDDGDSFDELFSKDDEYNQLDNRLLSAEADERQLNIIEKLVDVMDQQAAAMSQMAQASLTNSKALERIAEASHIQALAVDRIAGTFETISASVHDVRNAILGIDYTMKRCYPVTTQRQNSNIFS